MQELKTKLEEAKLSPKTINLYLGNLKKLNDNKEINNFNFLTKEKEIEEKINKFKPTTRRNFIIAICATLRYFPKFKKLYESYYNKLVEMNTSIKKEAEKNEMTETQKENFITWDEVGKFYDDLKKKVEAFKDEEEITHIQYRTLLQFIILSVYYLIPPRRNQDYLHMWIVKNLKDDVNKNYFVLSDNEFVFNRYKTSKTEKEKPKIELPKELKDNLKIYVKFHPLIKKIDDELDVPFLVSSKGEPLKHDNSITLILNGIFGKHLGSSGLRHIFLTNKYADTLKEMKEDSKNMSHSLQMQKEYIKE